MGPSWIKHKAVEWIARLAQGLARLRARSRVLDWGEGGARQIAVVGSASDPAHVELCLDALSTHFPGSRVTLFLDGKASGEWSGYREKFGGLAEVELFQSGRGRPRSQESRSQSLFLLHPYPYATAESLRRFRGLRAIAKSIPAVERRLYFRNLELWDDRPASRLTRRSIDLVYRPLLRLAESGQRAVMAAHVAPVLAALADTRAPAINEPLCVHGRRFLLFDFPRPIDFCPDCGMGLTPRAAAQDPAWVDATYGPAFATGGAFLGHREWDRHCAEFCDRLRSMLLASGFDPSAPATLPRRVLDAGCGSGCYAGVWTATGWDYLGVDPSARIVAFARADAARRARPDSPAPVFLHGDFASPEVAGRGPFGFIVLCQVLEHLPDPAGPLARLLDLAAPGGLLFVEVPHAVRYTWDPDRRGFANGEHLWDFTPAMLAATVAAAGWRVLRWTDSTQPDLHPVQGLLAQKM